MWCTNNSTFSISSGFTLKLYPTWAHWNGYSTHLHTTECTMEETLTALTKTMVKLILPCTISSCFTYAAGVLIIWDRIFGTFAPESDKVVYGLVHPLNSWNLLWAQFHHAYYIISNISSRKGFVDVMSFLFKGPGWSPGQPRLGTLPPKVTTLLVVLHVFTWLQQQFSPEKPYDPPVPNWLKMYCTIHFFLVLYWTYKLGMVKTMLPYFTVLALVLYMILSLTNFGLMFDCRCACAHKKRVL